MKAHHFIAPALAIAGSAYWLHNQKDTIRELTEENRIIKKRIVIVDNATTAAAVTLGSPQNEKQDEFTLPDGSLNWKMIAEMMGERQENDGMPTKALLKLYRKMMELSEDEIVDGLDKISALDLDPSAVEMLKQELLNQLSATNPLAALEALGDPITSRSHGLFWVQEEILSTVAKKDPAAAIAWVDKQISEGKLQSSTLNQQKDPRLLLETILIGQLMDSHYDIVKFRLEGFTNNEKIQLLYNSRRLKGEAALNFIKLARETLPPEKASNTISNAFGHQSLKKLSNISSTIAELPLNETEKTKVIENLVSIYSRNNQSEDKYQEIYQWSKTEAPGQEAAILGNALSKITNSWKKPQACFEEALALAESLGDPEILTSFVSKFSANGDEAKIKRQIQRFKDPDLAEQYRAIAIDLSQNSAESE